VKRLRMFKTRDVRPGSWKPDRNGNTLGDLVRKRLSLLAVCHRCKHEGLLFPPTWLRASARIIRQSRCGVMSGARSAAARQPACTRRRSAIELGNDSEKAIGVEATSSCSLRVNAATTVNAAISI